MFDLIGGLPIHPLVVHAVVVLLPLAAVGTVAVALRPSWRGRYGPLVTIAAALSVVLIPVATSSGEALQERVGNPGNHAELGDQLILFAFPLLILAAALTWLDRRSRRTGQPSSRLSSVAVLRTVAGLAVVAALATGVQVYRVGDSGARAAWGGRVAAANEGDD
ncbi:MAG: hypothetical protein LBQ06_02900 [Frankiaceae bacterium]|jgi:uncharacterized membrane protein|nr:hypothetical protein [Frankiaceae bacterium]